MPTVAVPTRRRLVSVPRHCVRVAKEMDSKSIGLCPQGFESPRCRLCDPVFFPISTILPCTWPAMPGRGSDSRSASGLRPRLSQQVIAMAVIAQLVARRSHNPKVVSSILTHCIFFCLTSMHIFGVLLSTVLDDLAVCMGIFSLGVISIRTRCTFPMSSFHFPGNG